MTIIHGVFKFSDKNKKASVHINLKQKSFRVLFQ